MLRNHRGPAGKNTYRIGRARNVVSGALVTATLAIVPACTGSSNDPAADPNGPLLPLEPSSDAEPPVSTADAREDAPIDSSVLDAGLRADALDASDAADASRPVDCSANPKLRTNAAGHFCAFAPGGSNVCANSETCCNPSTKDGLGNFYPSFCAAGKGGDSTCAAQASSEGSSYSAGSAWECADKNACGPASVCCLIQDPARLALDPTNVLGIGNTPATDAKHPAACGVKQAYNAGGTRCRAACAANEVKLCSLSDPTCAAGTTCRPFLGFFRELGYCAP